MSNRSQYPISVDCVIFGYSEKKLNVALIERKKEPFKGDWAIPGGFLIEDETVEEAAFRELKEETGIHDIYLEEFGVFSHPSRDPRGRVITVAFFALIASDKITLTATEDAASAKWFPIDSIPSLAFDHSEIYAKALNALKEAALIKPLVFELLPKEFTLTMLQNLYAQIFDTTLDKRNLRKKILSLSFIQETSKVTQNEKHRPAKLYQFDRNKYV
ncbi:MAG: NUDIX hydrolase, partial [Verrucomicrobia bacterium]|nr:NUDIX hydrolase [Verrucomicrobiota bacterium]